MQRQEAEDQILRVRALMNAPSPAMIAAAWDAWRLRHGGKMGPGPGFAEAVEAALRVALREVVGDQRTP